jgi:hypothetical protein
MTVERYRFAHRRDQAGGERAGIFRQPGARQDDRKLIATNARQRIALAQAGAADSATSSRSASTARFGSYRGLSRSRMTEAISIAILRELRPI